MSVKPIFVLLRHLPTVDDELGILTAPNAKTRLQPIDEDGLAKVGETISALAKRCERMVTISTSPSDRGLATAEALLRYLEPTSELVEDERLLNIDQGVISGQTQDHFSMSPLYWKWHQNPQFVHFPGGEHLLETARRVDEFISERCCHTRLEVVVSHTTPLQVMITRLLGLGLDMIWSFYFAYYSVSLIYGSKLIALNAVGAIDAWMYQVRE